MAKRTLVILCILALLLTGCSKSGEKAVGTEQLPDGSVQPEPSAQTDPQSTIQTTDPVETAAPTEPEPSVWVPEESAPSSATAGGYVVHIDTSHYTPYQPPESKYIRPEGVDLSEYHPENANGRVYPYAASVLYSSYEGGYSSVSGYTYGLYDDTGTLVTDGIYTNCSALSYWNDETDLSVPLPFWLVSRVGDVNLIHYEGDGYSYDYPEGSILCGLVSMDGTFSIPCEFVNIYARDDRIICTRDYSGTEFLIYDFSGNLRMTTTRLFDESADYHSINYGEGLYVVCNYYNEGADNCYYFNESGQQVLGPYTSAGAFHNGIACVSTDGEHVGYIDKTGSWVIPPRYVYCSSFQDGRAIARDNSNYYLIDEQGKVYLQKSYTYFRYFYSDSCGYKYTMDGDRCEFYDRDGNLLLSGDGDWYCLSEDVFYNVQADGVVIHRLDESVPDFTVPGIQYLRKGYVYIDGKLQEGYVEENYSNRCITFIPLDLSEWVVVESQDPEYYTDYLGGYVTYDEVTGEKYYCSYKDGTWLLFNSAMEQVGSSGASYPNVIDGMLINLSGLCCTYKSMDGELLFSFPYQGDGD